MSKSTLVFIFLLVVLLGAIGFLAIDRYAPDDEFWADPTPVADMSEDQDASQTQSGKLSCNGLINNCDQTIIAGIDQNRADTSELAYVEFEVSLIGKLMAAIAVGSLLVIAIVLLAAYNRN